MSKQNNLTDFLTDVADAIREKKGTQDLINPQDFSSEIASISGGGGATHLYQHQLRVKIFFQGGPYSQLLGKTIYLYFDIYTERKDKFLTKEDFAQFLKTFGSDYPTYFGDVYINDTISDLIFLYAKTDYNPNTNQVYFNGYFKNSADNYYGHVGTDGPAVTAEYTDKVIQIQDGDDVEQDIIDLQNTKADKSEVSEVANDLRTTKTRVSAVERAVGLLEEENLNLSEILDIIDAGLGKNYFKAGDQFHVNWKKDDTTIHNIDHDVVDLEDVVTLENGEEVTKHALTLQWHFLMTGILFDNAEFMAKTKATMPAGTYHFKCQHDPWSINNGKTYQFTATSDIPAGSFLRPNNYYLQSMAGSKMNVYADWGDSTAAASYVISEGSDGVDLGTMSSKTEQGQASTYLEACEEKGNIYLNDYQAVILGDNNYYYSYVRQYLNATTTGFFTQQHIFDRPPSGWSTIRGFLAGYDDEFISAIKPTKRVISSNTLVYGGVNYTMYDKIFLPTMANMNVDGWSEVQNTGGVEGNAYEYYKDLAVGQSYLNRNGTFMPRQTYAILKKYYYKNKGGAVDHWSSSALYSNVFSSLFVDAYGRINSGGSSDPKAVSPTFNLIK